MTELEFILVTIVIVIIITAIINKILTKANKQKKIIPKDENFDENLNNLDKIIEGVAVKEKNQEENNQDNTENFDETQNIDDKNEINNQKNLPRKNKKFDVKNAIIAKEIIDKKH